MYRKYIAALFFSFLFCAESFPCTSLIVTKGASEDGSVFITYVCDQEFHPNIGYTPAKEYPVGDSLKIGRGYIKQIRYTNAVINSLINDYQVSISETTSSGRDELINPDGILWYWDVIQLGLERAKTAREAIEIMTGLMEEYGYNASGETFSIADKNEAWVMDIFGTGPGGKGAIWVARRIPDGYICAHANKARISDFPLNDPENCVYSKNAISFAIDKGYYNPKSKKPFSFCEAYCPSTPKNMRYADTRVWSIYHRAAPSLNLSPDFTRAKKGAQPYPLWIKPDKKLSLKDVIGLLRDHYENTDFDMTKGIDAGPYGLPYRWRPMTWKVDSLEYAWERSISTQQTAFTTVAQLRSWLPDPVGGILWYGVDDTYTTCYVPLYCSIDKMPESYKAGSIANFSFDSAWWVFNFVANYANLKYSYMIQDIKVVQEEIENEFIELMPAIDKTAVELYEKNPKLMTKYLTDYSVSRAENTVDRWHELGMRLVQKYNDGYILDEKGNVQESGYPERWLREIIKSRPDQFRLQPKEKEKAESKLVD